MDHSISSATGGQLVLTRRPGRLARLVPIGVWIDGVIAGSVEEGAVIKVPLLPGRHLIQLQASRRLHSLESELEASAGQQLHMTCQVIEVGLLGSLQRAPSIVLVQEGISFRFDHPPTVGSMAARFALAGLAFLLLFGIALVVTAFAGMSPALMGALVGPGGIILGSLILMGGRRASKRIGSR